MISDNHLDPLVTNSAHPHDDAGKSFAAQALRMGGKTEEEVRRTGTLDAADDRVESLFEGRHQTANSPVHRAIWDKRLDAEAWRTHHASIAPSEDASIVMRKSLHLIRHHKEEGTLLDSDRKISDQVLSQLGEAGYWGLLIDKDYGGSGAPFSQFAPFLTEMATIDPTVAGLASVHGCIGAVDPLEAFGNAEQKMRLLPKLAHGIRLSAFALTEPGAGSDLTALRTTATRVGDHYLLNGEKLFITNVAPGRMIGVVCLIDDEPAVLIAELPDHETEHFKLRKYGLYALKHTHNQGILFRDFAVPLNNRLTPKEGDGLTIAYHGLNRGRVALCATAAGSMRMMLADMLPWAKFRRTYGAAIAQRELVQRRLGQLAGLIVACDGLTLWCSELLDLGYRGEMECIIAKVFGSEAQKEAAIELHMKTHGGRSFLHGHLFGDNVHEFLAPCIYEGEGEMLGMAFFKSLVKHHGRTYFEPIGQALAEAKIKQPNMADPRHLWTLRRPLAQYSRWWIDQSLRRKHHDILDNVPGALGRHAHFAADFLKESAFEISGAMRKYQLKLVDRQCRMAELSGRVQKAVVILCTALHGASQKQEVVKLAAETLCQRLTNELLGRRPSDRDLREQTKLGEMLAEGASLGFDPVSTREILMRY